MREVFIKSKDNTELALNVFENGFDTVLIIVHGWFMTKDSAAFFEMSECFSKYFDVIAMDCRGHGKSGGKYTFTYKEIDDVAAVVEYAKQKYKRIYIAGFSLGGALTVLYGALKKNVDKIISVSAPSRFEKIENHFWHPRAWIPTLQKCELKTWFSIRADFKSLISDKKLAPAEFAPKLSVPVLFIAGENDPTVFAWHTKELFERANCKKHFELIKDGLHSEDLFIQDKEGFVNLCVQWLLNN